jgi:hypothetical protein
MSRAIHGHTLCGRHAKMKTPSMWVEAHRRHSGGIIQIQAQVRGWLVRLRIRRGGPGVLSRGKCINEEDLVTCLSKDRTHPFDYIGFEEQGKVWWFDIQTLWKWSYQSHEPTNPYTKVALTTETRKRLRESWAYSQRHRTSVEDDESGIYIQRLRGRWNAVSQIFVDNGFLDVHPNQFLDFTRSELLIMFVLLERDIKVIFSKTDPGRDRALRLCARGKRCRFTPNMYKLFAAYNILLLLTIHKDPYTMTFSILSALYRC